MAQTGFQGLPKTELIPNPHDGHTDSNIDSMGKTVSKIYRLWGP